MLRQLIVAVEDGRSGAWCVGVLALGPRRWCWSGEMSSKPQ